MAREAETGGTLDVHHVPLLTVNNLFRMLRKNNIYLRIENNIAGAIEDIFYNQNQMGVGERQPRNHLIFCV